MTSSRITPTEWSTMNGSHKTVKYFRAPDDALLKRQVNCVSLRHIIAVLHHSDVRLEHKVM